MIKNPLEAINWINSRHTHWCARIRSWLAVCDASCEVADPLVDISWVVRGNYGARYWPNLVTCEYLLPLVMIHGQQYDETIAHECCHHFQNELYPGSAHHGEAFFVLLRHACGFKHSDGRHNYNLSHARQLSKTLYKLHKLVGHELKTV